VLARIVRRNRSVIVAHRYASPAVASKHPGIQVCNVVLHKSPGAAPQRFWRTVKAVRSGCHR
jgi:hypothetical protein